MINQEPIEKFAAAYDAVRAELARLIVGQESVIDALLTAFFARGNVLIEGLPGLGKTALVRAMGEVLDLSFGRVQFTPDLMPADITGTQIIAEDESGRKRFTFHRGPIFANILLADEVNRATPKTQAALLEAMQEQMVTAGGERHRLPDPFFIFATQNPIEMEGTYPLPEAQLDRFFFKVVSAYPTESEIAVILDRTTGAEPPKLARVLNRAEFLSMSALVRDVIAAEHVRMYAARIVAATHPDNPAAPEFTKKYVRYGASPRGAQTLAMAGKVSALLDRRGHLAAEDIRSHAEGALRHRIILSFEGESEGITTAEVIRKVLEHVREKV